MHKVSFEPTPNPRTYRFRLPQTGLSQSVTFHSPQETLSSPLAKKIFSFPWVDSIMLGPDFMTITKHDWVEWELLAEPLTHLIQEHLDLGIPVYENNSQLSPNEGAHPKDKSNTMESASPEWQEIDQVIQRDIRPILALDGGDIQLMKLEDQVLYVKLQGACVGCPGTQITLKEGIEARLKEVFPYLKRVELMPD
ncbi:MAG: NifU family protein [Bdellovibrionaceae bacterium]|nr:NifU family protein [Pseudobdellovibrionaceae bacterium]MDW8190011.1 NifU family protein [Pseudobdellovibrionaceae bacterium]